MAVYSKALESKKGCAKATALFTTLFNKPKAFKDNETFL